MKRRILLMLSMITTSMLLAQSNPRGVGINTTSPMRDLHVNGDMRLTKRPQGVATDSLLVSNSAGDIRRIHINQLVSQNSGTCPNFLRNQSDGYNIYFSSPASVPSPNNPLTIQGKNFTSSGTYIYGNTYYYSWTNTTGVPISIVSLTVNFGGVLQCTYNQ